MVFAGEFQCPVDYKLKHAMIIVTTSKLHDNVAIAYTIISLEDVPSSTSSLLPLAVIIGLPKALIMWYLLATEQTVCAKC